MKSRLLAAACLCAATVLGSGGTALAGEITGGGPDGPKPTPVATYENPNSICAFSGLNDVPDGSDSPEDPFAAGRVQSFGDGVQEVVRTFPGKPSDYVGLLQENKPGILCNKNRAPEHEE